MYNTGMNPRVNSGLWVIMRCPLRFIHCDQTLLWCRMFIGELKSARL